MVPCHTSGILTPVSMTTLNLNRQTKRQVHLVWGLITFLSSRMGGFQFSSCFARLLHLRSPTTASITLATSDRGIPMRSLASLIWRYNISTLSWVFPGVLSQQDMAGTTPWGGTQEASFTRCSNHLYWLLSTVRSSGSTQSLTQWAIFTGHETGSGNGCCAVFVSFCNKLSTDYVPVLLKLVNNNEQ